MAGTVETWSGEHIAALVSTAAVAALLVAGARRRGDTWAVPLGRGLAAVILGGYLCEHLTYALRGEWTAQVNLPLHLTDVVTLVRSPPFGALSARCSWNSCTSGRSARRCRLC